MMRANLECPGWLTSRGTFVRLFRERRQRSAPINRVSRFNGRHEQRPYSLGRIVMSLIHERGFPLLNPKLARHLGRALRPDRIEHANTLTSLRQSHIHRLVAAGIRSPRRFLPESFARVRATINNEIDSAAAHTNLDGRPHHHERRRAIRTCPHRIVGATSSNKCGPALSSKTNRAEPLSSNPIFKLSRYARAASASRAEMAPV